MAGKALRGKKRRSKLERTWKSCSMVRNSILSNKLPKKYSFPCIKRRLERRAEEAWVNLADGDKQISNFHMGSLSRMNRMEKGVEQGQESHARVSMYVCVFQNRKHTHIKEWSY